MNSLVLSRVDVVAERLVRLLGAREGEQAAERVGVAEVIQVRFREADAPKVRGLADQRRDVLSDPALVGA